MCRYFFPPPGYFIFSNNNKKKLRNIFFPSDSVLCFPRSLSSLGINSSLSFVGFDMMLPLTPSPPYLTKAKPHSLLVAFFRHPPTVTYTFLGVFATAKPLPSFQKPFLSVTRDPGRTPRGCRRLFKRALVIALACS